MAIELCHFQQAKVRVAVAGGSGSCGSGSLCTNSMGKFNFLISIDKKVHIFINSLPIALNLVPK